MNSKKAILFCQLVMVFLGHKCIASEVDKRSCEILLIDYSPTTATKVIQYPIKKVEKYKKVEMNPFFIGETSRDFHSEHPRPYVTRYLRPEEVEKYRVVIEQGQLLKPDGQKVEFPFDHVMNYVMDGAGNFYIFDQVGHEEIRHSSIFAGGPVAAAGEMLIENGRVVKVNIKSGHYKQEPSNLATVMKELKANGSTPLDFWEPPPI